MAEIAFRMLNSLTLKDPVNMESVVFRDPKNITRGGVLQPCKVSDQARQRGPGTGPFDCTVQAHNTFLLKANNNFLG